MSDAVRLMTIEVWEEFIDGEPVGWVGSYAPLEIVSQGNTMEEAIAATKDAIVMWTRVAAERMEAARGPDRAYRTGVHLLPPAARGDKAG